MMGYGGFGGMMGYGLGFGFLWPILWLVIIAAVIYALMSGSRKDKGSDESTAMAILKERLARGEIDYDEYVRIREGLKR